MNGAEVIVEVLRDAGVQVVFGLPGVHNLALWEALSRSEIRLVGVRHEQAAAYAADGYARATGRLGVAITTTGPGAANTLGAVGEAWASRSPILVIATDIATTLRRPGVYRGVLHETVGQEDLFRPVTKSVHVVASFEELAAVLSAAAAAALGTPTRPAYLQIPTDLLARETPLTRPVTIGSSTGAPTRPRSLRDDMAGRSAPGHVSLTPVAELLAAAGRPLLWVGSGSLGAADEVAALAERLGAPVITTYMARGLLGPDHPLAVGLPPHLPECGNLWDAADVVLAVGTDFDGMMTQNWAQPPPAKLVVVNVDRADASKNYPADVTIVGDAAEVLAGLLPLLARKQPWADLGTARAEARAAAIADQPEAMAMLDTLARVLPAEAVVVADMCIPGYWYAALGRVGGPRRLAYPVGWGTLGFGFPASMGTAAAAALGHVDGPVVCLCGDGGFLFAAGELATFAQEQLPVTIVLVDDGGYGMLRYDQKHAGQQVFGTELTTPDFASLAASFGIRAVTVDGFGEAFETALTDQVADLAPTMIVVRAQLDPPPTTSPRWYRRR
jgi:thiamine pyrophosphate-dependent acetolactate synthase large subunit-like protein